RAPEGNSVVFTGPITLNAAVSLFAGPNPTTDTVGSVTFSGPISGVSAVDIGLSDPRSHVLLTSASSTYSGGATLSGGSLGIGASSTGTTMGPLGTGALTIGGPATNTPIIYASGAPQSLFNALTLNNHL